MTRLSPRLERSLCSEGNKPHKYFKQHQKEDTRAKAAISWIQPLQLPTGYTVIHQGAYNLIHVKLSFSPMRANEMRLVKVPTHGIYNT